MSFLYVCSFSNGHIKVGRSANPATRIAQHEGRVSCVGIDLLASCESKCVSSVVKAEAALIQRCRDAATVRSKNEWFAGLVYEDVCEWMTECASATYPTFEVVAAIPRERPAQPLISALNRRYQFDPEALPRWTDTEPHLPHWPESGVMRWDLRPKDWSAIWPELIDHPCSILFAPTHPHRDGAPKFSDWVMSWPVDLDVAAEFGEVPEPVLNFVSSIQLRPDDWQAIWPELAKRRPCPARPDVATTRPADEAGGIDLRTPA